MITDYWALPKTGLHRLSGRRGRHLAARFHEDLAHASIVGLNGPTLRNELLSRVRGRHGWNAILARNECFQQSALVELERLLSKWDSTTPRPVVFAYSYAAKLILQLARKCGCKTILGQIDPGPFEIRLVQNLHKQHCLSPPDIPPSRYWEDWHEECLLADRIVVNSTWSRRALVDEGIAPEKVVVVPLVYPRGDDLRPVRNSTPTAFTRNRPLRVLFLGQVIARKGIVELTEAIQMLRGRPVVWSIVGAGDSTLINRLKEFPAVAVSGQIDRRAVVRHYQEADIFILPTHSDGFAITLLEAAAFEVPTITSSFCGEVVKDGLTGIILPHVAGAAIVNAIEQVLRRPELLLFMRAKLAGQRLRGLDELADDLLRTDEEIGANR